jgi:hypothetical protein
VLLEVLHEQDKKTKELLNEKIAGLPIVKSVGQVVDTNGLTGSTPSSVGYRRGLMRLSAFIAKYLGIGHISEITQEHWKVIHDSVVDREGFWRNESAFAIENALRHFVKVINIAQGNFTAVLSAKKESRGSIRTGRAPNESAIDYWASQGVHYKEWAGLFDEWSDHQELKNDKSLKAGMSYFLQFLIKNQLDVTPVEFMMMTNKPNFWNYLREEAEGVRDKTHRSHALKIYEFTSWVIKDKLSDDDDGEELTLATPLLELDVYHHIVGFTEPSAKGKADNVKAILPIKYLSMLREILTERDHEWPKTLGWTYKRITNHENGKFENVWHPHLTYLFLFMLEVPVRKIQVQCLDSGEGDEQQWVSGKWVGNTCKNANYWSKNYGDSIGRGVIRKAYSEGTPTTSIYINTNKTQDRKKQFSATSGYTINWHNESIIKIVEDMREWQRKYNPATEPTSYKDLPKNTFSDSPTKKVKEMIPDRFYLFRYPLNSAKHPFYASAPPADHLTFKFWHLLMQELEQRLKALGEDVAITIGWTGKRPSMSIFTPHSLRGSGLTALAEAGVPIEILSKVVAGHASILMTLGYIKYNNAYISDVLDKARLKIEQSEQQNYTQFLKNATWEDAYKYAVFNEEELNADSWDLSKAAHLFENRQIGICPNSGTMCNEGGPIVRKNINGKGADLHGPVEGGVGNCVRCRFFMTGLPFLVPLWLKANKDLSDAQQVSIELNTESQKLEELRSKRFKIVKEEGVHNVTQNLKAEIQQVEARVDAKSSKLDELLSNAHATYNLVERVKTLASEESVNLPALIDEDSELSEKSEFHEVSMFKQRDFIVQASRLYPHIQDDKLEMERNNFIDQIMFNMGMTPITLSPLSNTEKRAACDAASSYLNAKLSDYELQMLESGKIDIRDLGIGKIDKDELSISVETGMKKIAIQEVE